MMNLEKIMKDLETTQNQEFEFLDTLDLKSLYPDDLGVWGFMEWIELNYTEEYHKWQEEHGTIPDEEIFSATDDMEFAEYLNDRYGNV